jgi:hypothetical protein
LEVILKIVQSEEQQLNSNGHSAIAYEVGVSISSQQLTGHSERVLPGSGRGSESRVVDAVVWAEPVLGYRERGQNFGDIDSAGQDLLDAALRELVRSAPNKEAMLFRTDCPQTKRKIAQENYSNTRVNLLFSCHSSAKVMGMGVHWKNEPRTSSKRRVVKPNERRARSKKCVWP